MPEERLQKILAAAGVASRRGADALVAAGRVAVDGIVAAPGTRADRDRAVITVDGRPIPNTRPPHAYLAVHKPLGVTSTVRDAHARRTVLDLVADQRRDDAARLFPVGRLDLDSEGLLLLTDDGAWGERVLHPRYEVEREYAVAVERPIGPDRLDALRDGIELDEGLARARALRLATRTETAGLAAVLAPPPDARLVWYRVTIGQGWKRQVRRMFAAVGHPVRRLVRVRIGPLRLGGLASGTARPLRDSEVRGLAGTVPHERPTRTARR